MTRPGPRTESTVRAFPGHDHSNAEDSLAAYLATQILRCRCGFQVELPR